MIYSEKLLTFTLVACTPVSVTKDTNVVPAPLPSRSMVTCVFAPFCSTLMNCSKRSKLLTPVIFFNLVMQVIGGFKVFTQAFIITGGTGNPLDKNLFYALYLYQRAFLNYQMGYASAMAWVMLVNIAVLTFISFRLSKYWVFYETKEG